MEKVKRYWMKGVEAGEGMSEVVMLNGGYRLVVPCADYDRRCEQLREMCKKLAALRATVCAFCRARKPYRNGFHCRNSKSRCRNSKSRDYYRACDADALGFTVDTEQQARVILAELKENGR